MAERKQRTIRGHQPEKKNHDADGQEIEKTNRSQEVEHEDDINSTDEEGSQTLESGPQGSDIEVEDEYEVNVEDDSYSTDDYGSQIIEPNSQETDVEIEGEYEEKHGEDDYQFEDTPSSETGKVQKEGKNRETIKLNYDPEKAYFFVVGQRSAGKSMILASLIYYLFSDSPGNVQLTSDKSIKQQGEGESLVDEFMDKVSTGDLVLGGTPIVDPADNRIFPKEIHLSHIPSDRQKSPLDFVWIEMAGEDIQSIKEGDNWMASMPPGVRAYLDIPEKQMFFILVHDPKENEGNPSYSGNLLLKFLSILDQTDKSNSPILLIVSKWDLIKNQYNDVKKYMKEKAKPLDNQLNNMNRQVAYMTYSIGEVTETVSPSGAKHQKFSYDPTSPRKLFNWMYSICIGQGFESEINESCFKKLISLFRKKDK